MMVYSCVQTSGFKNLRDFWYPELKSYFDEKNFPAIIMVGNKEDLIEQYPVRAISKKRRQEFAEQLNVNSEVTCSCLSEDDVESVENAFKIALAAGVAQLKEFNKPKKSSVFKKSKIRKLLAPILPEKVTETYTDKQLNGYYAKLFKTLKEEGKVDPDSGLLFIDVKAKKFWTDKIGMASSHQSYEVVSIGVDIGEIKYIEKATSKRVVLVETE